MPPTDSKTGPKSLYNIARDVLGRYINTIDDVGDLEYRLLEPVLRKLQSPIQLKKLEENCPQLKGEDADLWKRFIQRDFGADAADKYVPKNPQSWSKVYDKHAREAVAASETAAASLRAQFSALSSAKTGHSTRLVSAKSLPPVPRRSSGNHSNWRDTSREWTVKAGSKTKNIVQRARREAKELSIFQGRNSKLAVPMHALGTGRVGREMEEKVKKAEGVRKRKAVVLEDEEEGEEEERDKGEKGKGPERKVIKRKPAQADPFMRPKKPTVFAPVAKRF